MESHSKLELNDMQTPSKPLPYPFLIRACETICLFPIFPVHTWQFRSLYDGIVVYSYPGKFIDPVAFSLKFVLAQANGIYQLFKQDIKTLLLQILWQCVTLNVWRPKANIFQEYER